MENPAYMNDRDALVAAAWDGFTDLVSQLLDNGTDINIQDETGRTALIAATDQGYHGVVSLLLDRGADPNKKDKDGDTALDIARFKEHKDIASLIIQHGGHGKDGPSAKAALWTKVHDDFSSADAVKRLAAEIQKKKDNRT